jgi:hypothetical protein
MDNDNENKNMLFEPGKSPLYAHEEHGAEQLARHNQRLFDEALVRTITRVIRENEDLRRELLTALGLENET